MVRGGGEKWAPVWRKIFCLPRDVCMCVFMCVYVCVCVCLHILPLQAGHQGQTKHVCVCASVCMCVCLWVYVCGETKRGHRPHTGCCIRSGVREWGDDGVHCAKHLQYMLRTAPQCSAAQAHMSAQLPHYYHGAGVCPDAHFLPRPRPLPADDLRATGTLGVAAPPNEAPPPPPPPKAEPPPPKAEPPPAPPNAGVAAPAPTPPNPPDGAAAAPCESSRHTPMSAPRMGVTPHVVHSVPRSSAADATSPAGTCAHMQQN